VLFPLQREALQAQEQSVKRTGKAKKKVAAPEVPTLTDAIKTRLFDLRKAGFNRLYQRGEVFEFSTPESLLDINLQSRCSCWLTG